MKAEQTLGTERSRPMMFFVRKPLVKGSLRRKLLFHACFSLTVILFVNFSIYFYIIYYNSKQSFERRVTRIASLTASLIDGQAYDRLQTRADEQSAEYRGIQNVLQDMQKGNPDMTDIYTLRMSGDGKRWEFVVGGNSKEPLHIGAVYNGAGQGTLKKAYAGAIAEDGWMLGLWGTGLRGYAPIKKSNGETVGIVGIHIAADNFF